MNVQEIKIRETRGVIQFGEALIDSVSVYFSLNTKNNKFTSIAYNEYEASGIFPEGSSRDVPQSYLVGRAILKSLKTI